VEEDEESGLLQCLFSCSFLLSVTLSVFGDEEGRETRRSLLLPPLMTPLLAALAPAASEGVTSGGRRPGRLLHRPSSSFSFLGVVSILAQLIAWKDSSVVPEMTYYMSIATLNSTHSLTHPCHFACIEEDKRWGRTISSSSSASDSLL